MKESAKIYLLFFVLLCSSFYSIAQQKLVKIYLAETYYEGEKTWLKKTHQPLNGNYAIKVNRRQTNYENFTDGLKNGDSKIYRNNKIAEQGLYLDNLKAKEWISFDTDGTVTKRTNFKNGLKDSIEKVYYKNVLVEINNYHENHLNGWTSRFASSDPQELKEKSFYIRDKKIKNIQYRNVDQLTFEIIDSLFYNSENKLILQKSFVNDTLKLQVEIQYKVAIKDIINLNTIRFNLYEGDKLTVSYFLPTNYKFDEYLTVFQMTGYNSAYYSDTKKTRLIFLNPERGYNKDTFYMQYPGGNLKSVIYEYRSGDELSGWYHRNID